MTPERIRELTALRDGLRGRFFYDYERGDIAYIAAKCEDRECDCEAHLNSDGDQDCSYSLEDWWGEEHICEPIAQMLNALPEALAEVSRLRGLLREACDIAKRRAYERGLIGASASHRERLAVQARVDDRRISELRKEADGE